MLIKPVISPTIKPDVSNPTSMVGITGLVSPIDPILGPTVDRSLVLDFADMDATYLTGQNLNLDFINSVYQWWELPPVIEGEYFVKV